MEPCHVNGHRLQGIALDLRAADRLPGVRRFTVHGAAEPRAGFTIGEQRVEAREQLAEALRRGPHNLIVARVLGRVRMRPVSEK